MKNIKDLVSYWVVVQWQNEWSSKHKLGTVMKSYLTKKAITLIIAIMVVSPINIYMICYPLHLWMKACKAENTIYPDDAIGYVLGLLLMCSLAGSIYYMVVLAAIMINYKE